MIRFIHMADLHLDQTYHKIYRESKQLALSLEGATRTSFLNIIATAINEDVDFVLISGDIYDIEPPTLKAQLLFEEGMLQLQSANIPVYMIYGNHDYLSDEKHRLKLPDNVHVFGTEINSKRLTTRTGETVTINGFSYPSRHVKENYAKHYPDRDASSDYTIGMLHGGMNAKAQGLYAPFAQQDLMKHHYDYWALGHIHKRRVIKDYPAIVYPGNIQGSSFKEVDEKGAYLVTLEAYRAPELEFISTAEWIFRSSTHVLPHLRHLDELRTTIENALHKHVMFAKEEDLHTICRLVFETNGDPQTLYWWQMYASGIIEQLKGRLENQNQMASYHVYLQDVQLHFVEDTKWSVSQIFSHALEEAFHYYEKDANYAEVMTPLMQHGLWQRYILPEIDQEVFKEAVFNRAQQKVLIEQAINQYDMNRGNK